MRKLHSILLPLALLAAIATVAVLVRSIKNRPLSPGQSRETVLTSLARTNPQHFLPADFYAWPISFSPDYTRVAVLARGDGRGKRFVIDNDPKPVCSDVGLMTFVWSNDSKRYAYTFTDYGQAGVVVDDKPFTGYARAGQVAFSDDGKHWFTTAVRRPNIRDAPEQHVVLHDGLEIASIASLRNLKFAGPDNHLEGDDAEVQKKVGPNGKPLPPNTPTGATPPAPAKTITLNTPPPGSPPISVNLQKIKHPRQPNTLGQPDPMNTYILTVNGRQIGEYTTVFPGPRADYLPNPDGTITFHVVKDFDLVRLTVKP
jgi:hypothetical protein